MSLSLAKIYKDLSSTENAKGGRQRVGKLHNVFFLKKKANLSALLEGKIKMHDVNCKMKRLKSDSSNKF